jgi:hypothetical protein
MNVIMLKEPGVVEDNIDKGTEQLTAVHLEIMEMNRRKIYLHLLDLTVLSCCRRSRID